MLPFYEYVNREYQIFTGTNIAFPSHLHSGAEMLYVKKGCVHTQCADNEISVKAGELIIFFPNTVHAYLSTDKGSEFSMFLYRSSMHEEISNVFATKVPSVVLFGNISDEIKMLLENLAITNKENPLATKLYFELILSKVFPLMKLKEKDTNTPQDLLVSVLSYIQKDYSENISLEVLSKKFGVSKYKISRLFTNTINISLTDYVNTLRIEKSKSLLKNPEISIIETAFDCGFESQQTFNRVFKKITGTTPKEYKKSL